MPFFLLIVSITTVGTAIAIYILRKYDPHI
jgi:hypothetical protein